jgi:hypothetical protein
MIIRDCNRSMKSVLSASYYGSSLSFVLSHLKREMGGKREKKGETRKRRRGEEHKQGRRKKPLRALFFFNQNVSV